MAERPLGHRKSSLVLSARFPGLKWRSRSIAKSAYYEKPRENDPWKNQHDSEAFWHFSIFGSVFFVLKSVLAIARQRSHEKFAILILKPRSHVKILIYRRWAIPPSSPIMASEADLRLLSRAALAWLLATRRMESLLAGYVTSETRPYCCWVLFGKRLLKLTFSFYQSSYLTKSFPGFQWDFFFSRGGKFIGRPLVETSSAKGCSLGRQIAVTMKGWTRQNEKSLHDT